jgi:hypothetical protein
MAANSGVTFKQDGTVFWVPAWAPDRIVTLASMKPGARIVGGRPQGSEVWHPSLSR